MAQRCLKERLQRRLGLRLKLRLRLGLRVQKKQIEVLWRKKKRVR
jgi:hypothetical protein